MRIASLILCLLAFCTAGHAAVPPEPHGLDKLAAYAGSWKTESKHVKTTFSQAGEDTAVLKNDCWRSGDFYACHQIVNGQSGALVVFQYDAKTGRYITHAIPANGGGASDGVLTIRDNVWTFPWSRVINGKTIYFHVINVFSGHDHIEYREEYSTDGKHWVLMAKGRDTRLR
ncbi:MAG TPA: hypothetical protein VFL15_03200 [Gammaproteobacteria bacterium]|nr:hypothetical protein [Gammaproteobacteria bacterium]